MNELIAFCGLNCEACDAYIATRTNDQALREKTAALWTELNGVPIAPEDINCEGCRTNGVKTVFCSMLCEIRQCALGKAVPTCAACADMAACATLGAITANSAEARENLAALREGGEE